MLGIQRLANLSPSQEGSLDTLAASTRPRHQDLAVLVLSTALLVVFWHHWLVLPLKLLVVLFHELGHAFVTVLTGGSVVELGVSLDQGGHTLSRGGNRFLILNGSPYRKAQTIDSQLRI